MSKALPFELSLDQQVQRSKLRRPHQVNPRALQALAESQLELHQELEQAESAELTTTTTEDQSQSTNSAQLSQTDIIDGRDRTWMNSAEIDRIESIDRIKSGLQPLLGESDYNRIKLINSLFDPC